MNYDREKLRDTLLNKRCESRGWLSNDILDVVETHLGLHTPAPVGGKEFLEKPQEKKCMCLDKGWVMQHGVHYDHGCPAFRKSPTPEARVELPQPGYYNHDDLVDIVNNLIRYLRAQENNKKEI